MITVRKKFILNEYLSVEMERDENERRIYLVNEPMQVFRLMATYSPDGRWSFTSPYVADEFFKLAQKYPAIGNNIHKEMLLPYEDGLFRMFKCAKRRIQIRVVRTGTKIKHIID